MTNTISIPLWLVIIGSVFAVIAFFSHFLFPSVRWFFRRSTNKAIDTANKRLPFKLPNLTLTKRQVLIERLVYDTDVMQAATLHSQSSGEPMSVTMEKVERYAKEIVPTFNAKVYFQFGNWICKKILQLLYRVRLGYSAEEKLANLDDKSSIVLVMNHRSNVDYILVAYLAMQQTALSYAVGEWARVWPLEPLIKSLGAYFVRRGSGNPLYRRVLERYVQMAVEGGVVQAVFPEGGLSRDGNFREPKIGLLDYMLRHYDPDGERDIVFVPVGLNYDRVLEDKNLLSENDPNAVKRSGRSVVFTTIK
ncbi:MAG: 1-acyl-sn-glycerol-3-phosphate acyltransferase, partial [Gammaproteobacteria bacterium]|nr:1-acyl-sn-glycerol-3-phosphate acyltransferase [Gammaproteobacteria bacterium]